MEMVVSDTVWLTDTVKQFTLVRADGRDLPRFLPGAHVETTLHTPRGDIIRSYSLCSPADETDAWKIAVKRSETSRGGSQYWHDHVRPGHTLHISAPINHFALSAQARHHVLVAAGIGITPFLTMLLALRAGGHSFELHYAARSPEQCPFFTWIQGTFPGQSQFYFSSAGERMQASVFEGRTVGTHLYLCGPHGMLKAFRAVARGLGYPDRNVHIEAFQSASTEHDQAFQVVFQRSRRAPLTVPAEESLLHALHGVGIEIPFSCQAGGCGTCQIGVVEGDVEHRDFFLTEEEQRAGTAIISCVSRARGSCLVLDI